MTTNKRFKRILALLLAAALCFSNMLSPALSAFADAYSTSGNTYVLILDDDDYNSVTFSSVRKIDDTENASTNNSNSVVNYSLGSGDSKTLTVIANKTGTAEIEYERTSGGDTTVKFTVVSLAGTITLEVGQSAEIAFASGNTNVNYNNLTQVNNNGFTTISKKSGTNSTFTVTGDSEGTMYVSYGTVIYKVIVTQPTTYSVTYDENGGTEVADASNVVANAQVNLPTTTRTGYRFDGWSDGTTLYTGNTYTVTGNVTLIAQWTANTYEITYNLNDNGDSTTNNPNPATYTYGTGLSLANATREGYTFDGWYLNGSKVESISATQMGNITLEARWTKNTYSVTYTADSGVTPPSDATEYEADALVTIKTPEATPSKTGYTFDEWTVTVTDKDGNAVTVNANNTFAMPAGGATVAYVAGWDVNKYTVTFASAAHDGVTVPAAQTEDYGTQITLPTLSATAYNFEGWLEGSTLLQAGSTYTVEGNVTLTAKWTMKTYTVTYKENVTGGTAADVVWGAYDYGITGVAVAAATTFSQQHATIIGWSTNPDGTGIVYDLSDTLPAMTENVTLYAVWQTNTYSLKYGTGGVTVTGDMPATVSEDALTVVTIPETGITATNKTFLGWTAVAEQGDVTWADNNNDGYLNAGDTITLTSNIELTALWKDIYTVTYSAGTVAEDFGGVDGIPSGSTVYESGEIVKITSTVPTRTGYTFAGWVVTKADGSAITVTTGKEGKNSPDVSYFNMPESMVTITATWTRDTTTVTYYHDHAYEIGSSFYSVAGSNYSFTGSNGAPNASYFYNTFSVNYGTGIDASDINTAAVTAYASTTLDLNETQYTNYQFVDWTVYDASGDLLTVNGVTYKNVDTATLEALNVTQPITVVANFEALNANFTHKNFEESSNSAYAGDFFTRSNITVIDYYENVDGDVYFDNVSNTGAGAVISWSVSDNGNVLYFDCLTTGTAYITIESDAGIETFCIEVQKGYTVSYAYQGDENVTLPSNPTDKYVEGAEFEISYPENLSKTGYTFAWGVSVTDGNSNPVTVAADGTFKMPASNVTVTFTEQWKAIDYTITYTLNGQTVADPTEGYTMSYTVEDEVTLPNLAAQGYDFSGWNDGTSDVSKIESGSTGDVALTATLTAINYKIDYNLAGGTYEGDATNPTSYTIKSETITLVNPSKTGYNFTGWVDENSNPVTEITTGSTGDLELTATWEAIEYTVTYKVFNVTYATETYTIESETFSVMAMDNTGYAFSGWYSDAGMTGDAVTEIANGSTGDITLYGSWDIDAAEWLYVSVNSYTGTYDGTAHGVSVVAVDGNGTVVDLVTEGATIQYASSAIGALFGNYSDEVVTRTDAGLSTVYVQVELEGYVVVDAFAIGTITVKQAELIVTATTDDLTAEVDTTDYTMTYGTATPSFGADAVGFVEDESYDFTTSNDFDITDSLVNAGSYDITVDRASRTEKMLWNYDITYVGATLTVEPAELDLEINPEDSDDKDSYTAAGYVGVYDATAHDAVLLADLVPSVKGVTYTYSMDGEIWSDEMPTITNAGEYTILVKADAGSNYTTAMTTVSASITPATLTITVADLSKTAGATDPTPTATVEGLMPTDGMTYSISRVMGESVGTYAITAFGATMTNADDEDATDNYAVIYVDGTLTINAAATTTTTTTTTTPTITEVTIEPEVVEETPVATTPAATTTEEPEAQAEEAPVEIEDTELPLVSAEDEVNTEIEDTEVPLVATANTTGWALLNLILVIGTVATSIIMLVSYFLNRRDEEGAAVGSLENLKLLSILPAAIAAIFFMLVSDMSSGMSFVDKWTLAMALIAIVQLAIVVVSGKGKNTTTGDDFV